MRSRFLIAALVAMALGPVTALRGHAEEADLPRAPASDRFHVDPGDYDDACRGLWVHDVRCLEACLQAAACATDDHGACRNPVLDQCAQKRQLEEEAGRPTPAGTPKR